MALDLSLDRLYVIDPRGDGNTFTITARVPTIEESDAAEGLQNEVMDALAAMAGGGNTNDLVVTPEVAASIKHVAALQRRTEQAACSLITGIGDVTSGGAPLEWPDSADERYRLFRLLVPEAQRQNVAQALFRGDTPEGVEGKSAPFSMRRG